MNVLLVAATTAEIEPALNKYPGLDVLITGVGSIQTCYYLHQKLVQSKYDFVIQAGIAGVFNSRLPLGSVVGVQDDCFGDLGFEENGRFIRLAGTTFLELDQFPFENGILLNNPGGRKFNWLEMVSAVTVNKCSDSTHQAEQLLALYDPVIESMEGAAFHYVCLQQKIPFMQLRVVSNDVAERDKNKWMMQESIANLNINVSRLIDSLENTNSI